ncbi:serine protease [Zoogloea dura]|uniref:Tetratricopeptide repeat protein n=1 Tax=Zoogloea dura TaxID=2728840 RepID=A0A848FYF0_9RHOO|nr:serine protease [Zoogloea dura]NML24938.1 tetratricopeptide repeat protein [Zoogloea dura]
MRRHDVVCGVLLGLAVRLALADETDEARQVFARVAPSVLTVRTLDAAGREDGQGSGVVVGREQVVTACHVIEDARRIRVVAGEQAFDAEWVRRNAPLDLCLLRVAGLKALPVKLRSGADQPVGLPVYAVGNPLGFGLAVSAGLLAGVEREQPYPHLINTAAQSPGSSGGGLFDLEGRLVGISRAIMGAAQNVSRAIPAAAVARLLESGDAPPQRPEPPAPERAWVAEAEVAEQGARWTALENLARNWLIAQPTAAQAAASLATALLMSNRPQEAEGAARRALGLDPFHVGAWATLARALHLQGRTAEAEEALGKAEAGFPANPNVPFFRAEWLRQAGRLVEAGKLSREAILRSPSSSSLWRQLGLIEEAQGRPAEAARAFAVAARLGDASDEVRRRLTVNHFRAGDLGQASRSVQRGEGAGRQGALAQILLGMTEFRQGRIKAAEEAMRRAVEQAPELGAAWGGLGMVLAGTQRSAEAERAFERALALDGPNLAVLFNRAELRRGQKRLEEALADARLASESFPAQIDGWRALGRVLTDMRRYADAESAYETAAGLGPLPLDDQATRAEAQLGNGHGELALKTLKALEEKDPRFLRMCQITAKVLGQRGDMNGALAYLERALEIEPANGVTWSSKGYALVKLGRVAEGVQALETAVRLEPGVANPWINLGEAQLKNRNLARAIQALEKAISLEPEAMDARLFLAQAYLVARLPAKTREQTAQLFRRLPQAPQVLGLEVVALLMQADLPAARSMFERMLAAAPDMARQLRRQAMANGVAGAASLPE